MNTLKIFAPALLLAANLSLAVSAEAQWQSNGSNVYTQSGRVGIGTSTPLAEFYSVTPQSYSSELYHTYDSLTLRGTNGDMRYPYFQLKADDNSRAFYLGWGEQNAYVDWRFENGNDLRISGSRVGIGVDAEDIDHSLTVGGEQKIISNNPRLNLLDTSSPDTEWVIRNQNGVFKIYNDYNSSVFNISNSNKVGIGTSDPQEALHAQGGFLFTDRTGNVLLRTYDKITSGYAGGNAHDTQPLQAVTPFENAGGTTSYGWLSFASPEVWGNENPYIYGHGNKNIRLGIANDGWRRSEIEIYNDNTADGKIFFRTGSWHDPANVPGVETNVRMMIDQLGNVGMGTTQPSSKLHVEGEFRLNGAMVSDGDICIGACGGITQQDIEAPELIAPATNENDSVDTFNIPQATNIGDEFEREAKLEYFDPPNDLIGAKEAADTQQEAQLPVIDVQEPTPAEPLQPKTQSQQEDASPEPQDVSEPDVVTDPSEQATGAEIQQDTDPIQEETETIHQTGTEDEPEILDEPAADTKEQPSPDTDTTELLTEDSSNENSLNTNAMPEVDADNVSPAADEPVSNDAAEEEIIVEEQTPAAPVSEPETEAAVAPEAPTEDAAE